MLPTSATAVSGLHGPHPLGSVEKACPELVLGYADNCSNGIGIPARFDSDYLELACELFPNVEISPLHNLGILVDELLFSA